MGGGITDVEDEEEDVEKKEDTSLQMRTDIRPITIVCSEDGVWCFRLQGYTPIVQELPFLRCTNR